MCLFLVHTYLCMYMVCVLIKHLYQEPVYLHHLTVLEEWPVTVTAEGNHFHLDQTHLQARV
jgi:hypothetical protein